MTPSASPAATVAQAGTWMLDPDRSTVGFAIRHLMVATVHGHFGAFAGSLRIDDEGRAWAAGTVRAATIETGSEIRDGRLRGPEFFDTARFPEIRFASTAIEAADDGTWRLAGTLTIKRTTLPIELRARPIAVGDDLSELELDGELSRSDFGMASTELLNAGISDTVKVQLHLVLVRAPGGPPAA